MDIVNDGHTAMITAKYTENKGPMLTGKLLNNQKYVFEQLHFHWGSENE